MVQRSEGIAASPQSAAHGADGLASGSASACGAELEDAQDGGSCGSVRYCVGAGCETVSPQSNTGFVNATTRLNMAVELGGEEFDRDNLEFFKGTRQRCHIHFGGLANCCKNSGLLVGLANCSASERELAEERNAGYTHYLGKYCSRKTFFGICIRHSRAWCVFGSKLGRILQQQGRAQLGIGWGQLPGADGRGNRGHRLRSPRSLGVHRGPDGRLEGAFGLPARRGRHGRGDAHAHPRLLQPGAVMGRAVLRALKQALAATVVWSALGAPAAGGEWRSWCPQPGSGASLGWHFYCDRQEEPEQAEPALPPPPSGPAQSATERIEAMRKALEEARAEAILDPTPAKVTAYLRLQQETLQRAAAFSDAFRRTVWATPELDYTLRRPVGALAKQVWSDERRGARDAALARLGERYGLIYLGHTGCAGCKVFGPLLRAFAQRHNLDVLAVSLTGEALEGWPEAVADRGRAARLGLAGAPSPALVLFDTVTRRVMPVGFGVMAEDQMAERIFALTALEPGNDY